MGPVEWTRLEGGQVEAVVAMFVNREHPNSVRITPSRGDGGVDILDRGAGPGGTDVVYQVKRYTDNLTARQKQAIQDSMERLATDKRWKGLLVKEWHLVTPWDPTPEAETWLHGLGDTAVTKIWHGLTWADQHAAKYDDVIDYYLHGGRALIQEAHAEVMALLGVENTASATQLTVPEVERRLENALKSLDHDPHYRYELRFGEGTLPPPPKDGERPGLVMHCATAKQGGRWTTVDIIARCAASTDERPILIQGAFTAEPGSEFTRQLDAFFLYGAPFASPEGTFSGVVDAPGGLGGPLVGATVKTGPAADHDLGANPDLHLEVLDPTSAPLAAADIRRVERSQGIEGGLRVVLEEVHGLFAIEDRYDLKNHLCHRSLSFGDFTGQPVTVAYTAIRVLSALHAPNRLRISVRHAAPVRGVVDPNIGFDWHEEQHEYLGAMTRTLETLALLQEHAGEVILTPEFTAVPPEQFDTWRRTAALLRGEEIVGTYPEGQCLHVELASDVTLAEGQDIRVLLPLTLPVGEQVVDLGHQEVILTSPTLVDRQDNAGRVTHAFTTTDRTIRWRRHDPAGTQR